MLARALQRDLAWRRWLNQTTIDFLVAAFLVLVAVLDPVAALRYE